MYDIEGKLRRRAMLERLEGLGRADDATPSAVAIPVPDQSPRPRHRNDPIEVPPDDDGLSPLHNDLSRRYRSAGSDDGSAPVVPVPVPMPAPMPVPDQLAPATSRDLPGPYRETGSYQLVADPYLEASPYIEPSPYADARPYTEARPQATIVARVLADPPTLPVAAPELPKSNGHPTTVHHPGLDPLEVIVPAVDAPLDELPVDDTPPEIVSSAATIADLLRQGANKLFFAAGPPPVAPPAQD